MPNLSVVKSAIHRYTVISNDTGASEFDGVSAVRNGIRYTIIDTDTELDLATLTTSNTIKARKVY